MSSAINTSNNSSETAKSLGVKILSVVGLTLFAGFYMNSWQRSLAEYAQKQQAETTVATSTTNTAPTVASESKSKTIEPTTISSNSEIAPELNTIKSVSAVNTVSEETAPVETKIAMAVAKTQAPAKITDQNTIEKLSSILYNQIDKTWREYPTFSENLVYRVTMNSAGMIAKYEHINKAASEYIAETPLPQLTSITNNLENTNKPTAEFLVLLTPNGVIQVNQWIDK